jgi:DNA-binding PadR family transcriptional regulator
MCDCECGCGQSHCWHDYPERGWIQFLILRVLYEKPSHGYKLMETIKEKSGGHHRLETGSIYTLLRRMEHRGLLESKWERGETTGPERRIYKVTKLGKEALRTGLESIAKRKNLMDDLAEFYKKNFGSRERR